MIVSTMQDVNLIGCCCTNSLCAAPLKECQSITVEACGYPIPDLEIVALEDRCKIFKKRTDTYNPHGGFPKHSLILFRETTSEGTYDENRTCVFAATFVEEDGERSCIMARESSSYNVTEDYTETFDDDGSTWIVSSYSVNTSSTGDGECTGTYHSTQTFPSNPGSNSDDTGDYIDCTCPSVTPDESFTYSSPGIFTKTTDDSETKEEDVGTTYVTNSVTYTEPFLLEDLTAEMDARLALLDEGEDWPGESCAAATVTSRLFDDDEDPDHTGTPACEQVLGATRARYRIGIPDGYSTEDHPRSVYECQWDEGFFPKEWDDWKILKDAFDLATAVHKIWEDADPDTRGPEPPIPDDPGDEPTPLPELVTSREWTWDGSTEEDSVKSEWFTMEPHDTEGEVRVVNMLVICWHSGRLGTKPTSHGETYNFDA